MKKSRITTSLKTTMLLTLLFLSFSLLANIEITTTTCICANEGAANITLEVNGTVGPFTFE